MADRLRSPEEAAAVPAEAAGSAARAAPAWGEAAGPAVDALRAGRPPLPAGVVALQRAAGNAAVGRLLSRRFRPPTPSLEALEASYNATRKAKQDYVDAGKKGPITYDPSKRNKQNYYGGFDVEYDPADDKQLLTISMRGVADFKPGMRLRKGRAVPVEPSPQTLQAAKTINADKDPAKRATEVAKWQWSSAGGPDAGDEAKFMTDFKSAVEGAWQGKHPFYCTRRFWEDLGATVAIDVNLVKMDDTHKPGSPYHMKTIVYKVPPGYVGGSADVHREGKGAAAKRGAFSNVMTLTAADVQPRGDNLLTRTVTFEAGKTTIEKKRAARLKGLAKEMPNAKAGSTAPVADLTISAQGADETERKARFDAIVKVFTDAGMSSSRLKYLDGGVGDVCEITIGSGAKQTVAAHESGHMFGLDDEYTGGGAYAAGKKTEHTDFAAQVGETGILHAKSDNIMSEGGVVRRQHYATFLDALKVVSGMEDWMFGAKRDVYMPIPIEYAPVPDELMPGRSFDPMGEGF